MTIDLAAKGWTVYIGDLDVTDIAESLSLQYNQLDRSGLWICTGTLEVNGFPANFSEIIDPRRNPARWAAGVEVIVSVIIEDTLTPLPMKLSILKRPSAPYPGRNIMSIKVGDDFALKGYRSPPGDASSVTIGSVTNADVVINSLLAEAGFNGTLNNSISEHPFDCPLQKTSSDSYSKFAGAIAQARNYYLWQKSDGNIQADRIDLDTFIPVGTYAIGLEDAEFFPVDNDESPPETLTVTGTTKAVAPNLDPSQVVDEVRDPEDGNAIVQRNTFKVIGKAASTRKEINESRIQKKILFEGSSDNTIALAEETIVTKQFDGLQRLFSESIETRQLKGVSMPELLPGDEDEFTSKEILISYIYNDANIIAQKITTTREPKGLIAFSDITFSSEYDDLTTAEITKEFWTKTDTGEWLYRKTQINYREGEESSKLVSKYVDGPPRTEYQEPAYVSEDKQVSGTASFESIAGDEFRPQPSPIQLRAGMAVSDQQCVEIAELEGRLMHGRAFGVTWALGLTQSWITNFSPCRRVDFVKTQQHVINNVVTQIATTTAYLTDGLNLAFDKRSQSIGGDGIEIGEIESSILLTPYITANPIVGGLTIGGVIVDSADVQAETVLSGLLIGGVT